MIQFTMPDEPEGGSPRNLQELLDQLSTMMMSRSDPHQEIGKPETIEALKIALTDDSLKLSQSLAREVSRLDQMLDQGVEAHTCGYPNCIVTELLQLRSSQRERTNYAPIFHITNGKWAEPGQPESEGFTRFLRGNYPKWLVEWVQACGRDPDKMPMIDIQFVGELPADNVGYNFSNDPNDPNDPSMQMGRVVEIDFDRACFEHLLTMALTDDNAEISDEGVLGATRSLDDSIDLNEPHICRDPACRFEEFRQLRLAQRERIGYKPEFRIARVDLPDDPSNPVQDGYTRYLRGNYPNWLLIALANDDFDAGRAEAIDVAVIGTPPEDDSNLFAVLHVLEVHDVNLPVDEGFTRYFRNDGYPQWLIRHVDEKYQGRIDLDEIPVLEAKIIGTPPENE